MQIPMMFVHRKIRTLALTCRGEDKKKRERKVVKNKRKEGELLPLIEKKAVNVMFSQHDDLSITGSRLKVTMLSH